MTGSRRGDKLSPTELDPAQRALYESIVAGPRARQANSVPLVDQNGCLEGPFNAFLLQPSIGHPLQALGAALRYATQLPDRWREITILVVAAHSDAEFERYAHEPIALSLGLTSEQLAGIQSRNYDLLPGAEALVARAAGELLDSRGLSDDTYNELYADVGAAQIFELCVLVGYYSLLAVVLSAFHVPLPDEVGRRPE